MKKTNEEVQKEAEEVLEKAEATGEAPMEIYIRERQYKLAKLVDESIAIYVKPRAWYIPKFIYAMFLREHVMIVNFNGAVAKKD